MRKQILPMFLFLVLFLGFLIVNPAYAKKPPWAGGGGGKKNPPPSAPEPVSLILIGMGASGAIGFYLGKKNKK